MLGQIWISEHVILLDCSVFFSAELPHIFFCVGKRLWEEEMSELRRDVFAKALHFKIRKISHLAHHVFCFRVFFITVASSPIASAKCLRVGCAKTRKRSRLPSSDYGGNWTVLEVWAIGERE